MNPVETYDNSCGAALHNPDFDQTDGITDAENKVLGLLEAGQALAAQLDAVKDELQARLVAAVGQALPLGALFTPRAGLFGSSYVFTEKSRGEVDFEVAGPVALDTLNITRPTSCRFCVTVYPVDKSGTRTSETAAPLFFYLGEGAKPVSLAAGNGKVCEFVRKLALASVPQVEAPAGQGAAPVAETPVCAGLPAPSASPAPGFSLTPDELARFEAWAATKPRSGAVDGAQFQFSFLPTSIGLVSKVKCLVSGDELDLTDYDRW